MSNVLDQWLGDSISAIEMLEREMTEHHQVIQQAMATIRRHTAASERLETHIEVIRGAAHRIEGAIEEVAFDESFDEAYSAGLETMHFEDSDASAAPLGVDEGAGTPVIQLVAGQPPAAARARLPPPPPSAATRR